MDLFEKLKQENTPLGKYSKVAHGYFMFPKLEGEIGSKMLFRGKEKIIWSLNNYIGLANHPEIREADTQAAKDFGMAYPMGARMMSGQTNYHEKLEKDLAEFVKKEDSYLLNFGYQGMVSIIDTLVSRHDIIVYDSESHACIIDGMRMHFGKRLVFPHNNMEKLEKELQKAEKMLEGTTGGILVITEGVFGMSGDLGKLDKIAELKKKYQFRLLVDDAHGFGTMGKTGAGVAEHFDVEDAVDLYFGTFAKAMASIGGFIAGNADVINYLRYNMRSQIFAKSLPMPITIGALKRLELLRTKPELRDKLWLIVNRLQQGLKDAGFDLGATESPVTPVFLQGDIAEATNIIFDLRENHNIFCSMVVYPVVPKGVILLRLIPTATHTIEEVDYTIEKFKLIKENLEKGIYRTGKVADVIEAKN